MQQAVIRHHITGKQQHPQLQDPTLARSRADELTGNMQPRLSLRLWRTGAPRVVLLLVRLLVAAATWLEQLPFSQYLLERACGVCLVC